MKLHFCVQYNNNWKFVPENVQNTTELIYFTSGPVTVTVSGKPFVLNEGEMIVIAPDVSHSEFSDCSAINNICVLCDLDKSCEELHGQVVHFPNHIRPLFNMLIREYEHSVVVSELAQNVLELIIRYSQSILNQDNFSPYVKQMVKRLKTEYTDSNLKIKDIQADIPLSNDYLRVLFEKEMGTTPQKYLETLRMERSRQLLTVTNSKIYEIAENVGYSDSMYFSRIFTKFYGISPSDFRKQLKDTKNENYR